MKKLTLLFISVFAVMSLYGCGDEPMKISIFEEHIEEMATQRNISYREAAILVREMGYMGVDCKYQMDREHLRILDSLGFSHVMAIARIDITDAEHQEDLDEVLDFMKTHEFSSILLIPGLYRHGASDEDLQILADRWRRFTAKAESMGFKVVAEDVDQTYSPIKNIAGLSWAFNEVPSLGCAFDVGNFLFAGDDAMEAYRLFRSKIVHVHLKDRPEVLSSGFANVGYGIAPIKECILDLQKTGYNGWYVVELYGSEDLLSDSRTSINFLLTDKDINSKRK